MFAEGAVVGEYTLQRKLGQGPLAEVWRARKVDRTEPVALKLLRPGALTPAEMRKAFDRLVQVLSEVGRLEHPHLPATLGTVRRPSDGLFGLAIPYFDGGPLFDAGDLTDPGALHDALELVVQLGQTVMWLHDQGVVHGAIKPTNVLASPSLTGPSVRLLDLCWSRAGLCRFEGTRFEPPELTEGPATPESDQWAIARLVRGLVARRAPEPISAWARVPSDLRHAVDRSLSTDPRLRFDRTADLIDALVAAQTGLSSNAPTYPEPDSIPAPTVAVPKQQQPQLEEVIVADPTEDALPKALTDAPDAPTEPQISDPEQAQVRELAGQARTLDLDRVPKTTPSEVEPFPRTPPSEVEPFPRTPPSEVELGPQTSPGALATIDPSADSNTPSSMVRPPPHPADPTAPLTPAPPERSPLPFVIAAAAAIAIALYAWTVTTSNVPLKPEAPVRPFARVGDKAAPPESPPPEPPPLPTPKPEPAAKAATLARAKAASPQRAQPPPPKTSPAPARPDKKKVDVAAKDHAWGDCRKGVRRACIALAKQHERLGHWRAAAKSRDQACRQGHRGSCLIAAAHYVKAKQGRIARRRFEKLCDNRVAPACAELSVLFRRGVGGRKNLRTANAFKLRACQLGHKPSCD